MSKCKTVQDEKKILNLVVRRKEEGKIIEKRTLKSEEKPKESTRNTFETSVLQGKGD